jgi:hypothetical protein
MARLSKANIDKAVNDFGKAVVKRARANLTREKGNASKTLWNSIKYKFQDNVIVFSMEPYGIFLDKGVSGTGKLYYRNGKFKPVAYNKSEASPEFSFKKKVIISSRDATGLSKFRKWLQIRSIDVSDFVIRRSIAARGIRPRRFFTNAFNDEYDNFEQVLDKVITLDVEENVDQILSTLKN